MWKKCLASAVIILFLSSLLAPSIRASPAWVEVTGDTGKVNVVINYWPGVDKYGQPSVNPDGSFYPNDQFWVRYSVYSAEGLEFKGVEAAYDQSAFEKLQDSGWGSTSGMALFRVKQNAKPGQYDFKVKAEAHTTAETVASGSVTVTVGGVRVDAYYHAECRLTILSSDHGSTVPAPGTYWYVKGAYASVTAFPDAYYQLDFWLLDGENAGSSNPISVSMDAPHTLQPVFSRIQYQLSISATDGGTTNPPPGTYYYKAGTYVSVSANAYANYTFSHWILDGSNAGSSNPINVFMDASHSVTAVFEPANTSQSTIAAAPIPVSSAVSKLIIKDLKWTTWFDIFRGTVCQAKGYLYSSSGAAVAYSDVVVEYRKRNFWTGAAWVVEKTVKTNGEGFFVAEETCNPLSEKFLGVQAWAEKPGYLPSWSLLTFLDPYLASVGQGSGFLVGVRVYLVGRYTAVPVSLSAENIPPECTVMFNPTAGEVDGLSFLQSVMFLNVQPSAPLGSYTLRVKASSGAVSSVAPFSLEVTEPVRVPSTATFTAYGLDQDATGLALTLDDSVNVTAEQLPYTANWRSGTQHTYNWSSVIGSEIDGKRYVLDKVLAVQRYVTEAIVRVEVVKYDPQFTVVLAYTMPKEPGNNSYEKPFAMIIRYDGNGPERKLGQRAVIEDWSWSGYASRIAAQQRLTGLTGIPDLSKMSPEDIVKNLAEIMKLFNLTGGVTFDAAGIDAKTEGTILKVDGESLTVDNLPKTYSWPEDTTHVYEWSVSMPVYVWVEEPMWGTGHYEEASDEWFGFQYAQVQIPQINVPENATLEQLQKLGQGFAEKLYSPTGKINATKLGNRVLGVYSHNKLLTSIAKSAGVEYGALKLKEPQLPVFFNNESRYAKFVFDLDDRVASEAVKQLYNISLHYEVELKSSMFTPHTFKANFTCPLEYYQKAVTAKAFKWNPIAKNWTIDYTVRIETVYDVAFNTTEADWFRDYLKDQTVDETALKMASEDIYECYPQYFDGLGVASGVMNRTSAYYYNLNATAGRGYYAVGSLPQPPDAWTEAVKTQEAWWTSPTSTLSADSIHKSAGEASIRVDEGTALNASAVLSLLKPIRSWPQSELRFRIHLGDGCSGRIYVYMEGHHATAAFSTVVQHGSWTEITVRGVPFNARRVGIYAELQGTQGTFWIDDLAFRSVDVWKWTERSSLEKTVYMDFASDKPYAVYVNLDPLSPLPVNVTSDDVKTSRLTVDAAPELGGLANITVYTVVNAPAGYSLDRIPVESLQLRKLFTVNLTAPEQRISELNFSGYQGYSAIHGGVLGFSGQTELYIVKDPEMKALPGYNGTLLLIEATNVWGTTFHTVVAVQPWGKTFIEVMFEQVAYALFGVAMAAVIVGLVIRFLRESRGQA